MYSQIQIPIPIHGDTIECVVKIKFVFVILLDDFGKNYFMDNNAQTTEIGTCITYLIPSKNAGIGPIPILIPGTGAALKMVNH